MLLPDGLDVGRDILEVNEMELALHVRVGGKLEDQWSHSCVAHLLCRFNKNMTMF